MPTEEEMQRFRAREKQIADQGAEQFGKSWNSRLAAFQRRNLPDEVAMEIVMRNDAAAIGKVGRALLAEDCDGVINVKGVNQTRPYDPDREQEYARLREAERAEWRKSRGRR